MSHRRKKVEEGLLNSFGKPKEDSFNFNYIGSYFRQKDHSGAFQVLSDKTCNDLDLEEVFMYVDRTHSKVGQQYLYNRLRVIPADSSGMEEKEQLIDTFTKDVSFQLKVQYLLSKLNNRNACYITSLFQDEYAKPPKWFFVVRLLSFASILSIIMIFIHPQIFPLSIGLFIINLVIHYRNKRTLYLYLDSFPQLLRLHRIAGKLYKEPNLKVVNPRLQESLKVMDRMKTQMSYFNLESRLQGDLETAAWGMLELVKVMFLIEPLIMYKVLTRLDDKRKDIEALFEFVGQTDTLISIASLRSGLSLYCLPQIAIGKKHIDAIGVYHPLITDCVGNDIRVSDKSILLTGSNMSGKTSFIRTVGINVICGQTLNTCFASSFAMSWTRVFSAIRISDDLMNSRSYYFEEVLTIKEMLDKSIENKPNLFLLDEIFKGTNTIERISAGKAVLSALAGNSNMVFVSTHDIELTDLLKDEYALYHFSEKVESKMVDFDYKLKEGKLKNRNAIRILEINDYPPSVVTEAIEISKSLDEAK